jgi:hypothetical protein
MGATESLRSIAMVPGMPGILPREGATTACHRRSMHGAILESKSNNGEQAMAKKKQTRTTLRSSTGTKLYAVRNADGTFNDIQSYKRAHAQDLKRTSKVESAKKKKAKKKVAARKK